MQTAKKLLISAVVAAFVALSAETAEAATITFTAFALFTMGGLSAFSLKRARR